MSTPVPQVQMFVSIHFIAAFPASVWPHVVLLHLFRYLDPSSSLEAGPAHPYEELEAQFPSALLEELFGITLLIGRLKDLPANVQSAFTIPNPGKVCVCVCVRILGIGRKGDGPFCIAFH